MGRWSRAAQRLDRRLGSLQAINVQLATSIHRKREDNIVELRKNKRDENLQKKRMIFAAGHDSGTMEDSTRGSGMHQKVMRSCKHSFASASLYMR